MFEREDAGLWDGESMVREGFGEERGGGMVEGKFLNSSFAAPAGARVELAVAAGADPAVVAASGVAMRRKTASPKSAIWG